MTKFNFKINTVQDKDKRSKEVNILRSDFKKDFVNNFWLRQDNMNNNEGRVTNLCTTN